MDYWIGLDLKKHEKGQVEWQLKNRRLGERESAEGLKSVERIIGKIEVNLTAKKRCEMIKNVV